MNHTWLDWASPSPFLIALSSRVATLEGQLAKSQAEKTEAERINQCILRAQIEGAIKDAGLAKPTRAASKLRLKLVQSREINRTLQANLQLVLQLLASHYGSSNGCVTHTKACSRLNVDKVQKSEPVEDLIDLTSEPTALDFSKNDTVWSAQPRKEEESDIDAYESENSEAHHKNITSHAAVDPSHTPYIYRFGHGIANSAPNIDIGRKPNPGNNCEIHEQVRIELIKRRGEMLKRCQIPKLATGLRPIETSNVNKFFPSQYTCLANSKSTRGNLSEAWYEVALPSPIASFDSSSTIAVPVDECYFESPTPELFHPTDPKWFSPQIFSSQAERDGAIDVNRHHAGPNDLRFPDLFRHGIRFSPDPSERDLYRTILVSDLGLNSTIAGLLDKVRGGLVVSAMLLDTVTITGKKTALIVFHHEHEAKACEENAKLHPIAFDGLTARVELVPTPTWPESIMLRKAINDHHHTRCLEVHKFPRRINPSMLRRDLRICSAIASNGIEYIAMRAENILELRFTSIQYAGQAFGILTTYRDYRQCVPRFVPDPCAQPLQLPLNSKAIELEKYPGHLLKLELKQHGNSSFEDEASPIDQTGRLEIIEGDGFTTADTCTTIRGRGSHLLI